MPLCSSFARLYCETDESTMLLNFAICNQNNTEQLEEAVGKLGLFLNRPELCIVCIACQHALYASAEAVSL
jgi:hypothetical protein